MLFPKLQEYVENPTLSPIETLQQICDFVHGSDFSLSRYRFPAEDGIDWESQEVKSWVDWKWEAVVTLYDFQKTPDLAEPVEFQGVGKTPREALTDLVSKLQNQDDAFEPLVAIRETRDLSLDIMKDAYRTSDHKEYDFVGDDLTDDELFKSWLHLTSLYEFDWMADKPHQIMYRLILRLIRAEGRGLVVSPKTKQEFLG